MRLVRLGVLLGVAALTSAGCLVVSLEPLYDARTLQFEERLLGTWENAEQKLTVVIEQGEWQSYKLTYTDRTGAMNLVAHGTRIGDAWLLDVTPAKGLEYGPLVIPVHLACRVQLSNDTFTAAALNYDWFVKAAAGRSQPEHTFDSRKNVVLTAGVPALRAWLLGQLKTDEAFGEPVTFTRKKIG
jgi:hypothetical protein